MIRRLLLLTVLTAPLIGCLARYEFVPQVQKMRRNQALFQAIHSNNAGGVRKALADGADPSATEELEAPFWKRFWWRLRGIRYPHQKPIPALCEAVGGWYSPTVGHWVNPPDNPTLVGVLLDAGADVNTRAEGGVPIFLLAASADRIGTVNVLKAHGADVNAPDRNGSTALMFASEFGQTTMVSALLTLGATPDRRDTYGMTALMWAVQNDNSMIVSPPEERARIVALLLRYGADPRLCNGRGTTALDLARRLQTHRPADRSLPPAISLLEHHR